MILASIYGTFVGLSLGLTGGGGSTFAVPLLVYGLGLDFRRAVSLSLAVVGLTALYGAILQRRKQVVLWRAGALLGVGGILAAPFGSRLGKLLPDRVSLLLFAALMIFIGIRMLRDRESPNEVPVGQLACDLSAAPGHQSDRSCAGQLFLAGGVAGFLSGVFGVGGGFLLVPALLLVAAVSIERAIGTSLVAIFLISASGFASNFGNLTSADLGLACWFSIGAGIGMTLGIYAKTMLPSHVLKRSFAVMVLCTAAFVITQNI